MDHQFCISSRKIFKQIVKLLKQWKSTLQNHYVMQKMLVQGIQFGSNSSINHSELWYQSECRIKRWKH